MKSEPRIIRSKDAPGYLGMDKNKFNELVRPYVNELRYGSQSVGFDKLDLDAWIEHYKAHSNGRPEKGGIKQWDAKRFQGFSKGKRYGTSIRSSEEDAFARALENVKSKKR